MSGYTDVLERARTRLEPPPGGLERQYRRRERRARRRRVVAGVLALLVAGAGLAGAVWIVRRGADRTPAVDERTSTITPSNVGEVGLAWTAETFTPGGLHVDPVVVDGLVFLAADHLFAYEAACRADGGECEPRWFSHILNGNPQPGEHLALVDGDVILQGRAAIGVCDGRVCEPDASVAWVAQDLPHDAVIVPDGDPARFRWLELIERRGELLLARIGCVADPSGNGGSCDLLSTTDLGVAHPFEWRSPTTGGPVLAGRIALATATPYLVEPRTYRFGPYGVPRLIATDVDCQPLRQACEPLWVGEGPAGVSFEAPVVAGPYAFVRMYEPAERSSRVWFRGILGFRLDCAGPICAPDVALSAPRPNGYADVTADGRGFVYLTWNHEEDGERTTIAAFDCSAGRCVPESGTGRAGRVYPVWHAELEGFARATPLITDEHIVVPHGTTISAFALDGPCASRCDPAWSVRLEGLEQDWGWVPQPVEGNGLLFAAPFNGRRVYALDPVDGSVVWSAELPARIRTNAVLAGDGVYVGGGDGSLYAFRLGAGGEDGGSLPWPVLVALGALLATGGVLKWRRRTRARIRLG
jgi:hypothetical protein